MPSSILQPLALGPVVVKTRGLESKQKEQRSSYAMPSPPRSSKLFLDKVLKKSDLFKSHLRRLLQLSSSGIPLVPAEGSMSPPTSFRCTAMEVEVSFEPKRKKINSCHQRQNHHATRVIRRAPIRLIITRRLHGNTSCNKIHDKVAKKEQAQAAAFKRYVGPRNCQQQSWPSRQHQ